MATAFIIDKDDIFLGRVDEQERFRETLRTLQRETGTLAKFKGKLADTPDKPPFVFLLYAEGGMGKSRLAGRLRDIATQDEAFKEHFRVIAMDWENRKQLDMRLIARDAVTPETVFENLYAVFRDEGFGREFDPYEEAVKARTEAETKVAQALERVPEGGERYAKLRDLGGQGLSWLVRSGVLGALPIPVSEEWMSKTFGAILGSGPRRSVVRAKLRPRCCAQLCIPMSSTSSHCRTKRWAANSRKAYARAQRTSPSSFCSIPMRLPIARIRGCAW